jgi:integrase/recombinase XerC/integrase/recombinase XerD
MRGKRNLRWEDVDKRDIELRQLIQHFEVFNRSEGKSPRTVSWYSEALNSFLYWLESENRSTKLKDVGESEGRAFALHLYDKRFRGKPLSTYTVANRVRALRGFFSWLAWKGYTADNALADFKPPKTAQTIIEPLAPQEVNQLFTKINQNTSLGARNGAILALFLDTGVRLSELADLKECDVHLEQRYVKVMGKGAKERIVPFGVDCQKTLLHYYYHFRPERAHSGVDTFFLTLDGYAMTADAIKSLVKRLAKAAAVPRLHPHLFRHTYATRFLLNGGDVFLLKQNLGHSTLLMVEHYRHIASRQAALMGETFSPLDRMNLAELRRQRRNHSGSNGTVYPNAGLQRSSGSREKEIADANDEANTKRRMRPR